MQRWRIDAAPAAADLDDVAALLRAGGIVLLPTDTIYGLHALANDDDAIHRLANIKGRDDGKPFVVVGASIDQLMDAGVSVTPDLRTRLDDLWPAPLTAILPLSRPVAASRGASSLAVRIPDLTWLRSLANLTGLLASTSANRSGNPPITTPDQLEMEIDGVVDRGVYGGEPSMIVDFTGAEPRVLREGEPAFTQKVWKTLRKTL